MEKLKTFVDANKQLKSENKASEFIKFKGTGIHYLKLIRGESHTQQNFRTKKDEEGVLLFFLEDGNEKKYFVPMTVKNKETGEVKFHYLIERFAEIPEETDLIIEYKPVPGTPRGFLDIRFGKKSLEKQLDDIPVLEEKEKGEYSIKDIINDEENGDSETIDEREFGVGV